MTPPLLFIASALHPSRGLACCYGDKQTLQRPATTSNPKALTTVHAPTGKPHLNHVLRVKVGEPDVVDEALCLELCQPLGYVQVALDPKVLPVERAGVDRV